MREITNYDDLIDSRDVEERIADLENYFDPDTSDDNLEDNEREELSALKALRDEAKDYSPDWFYGSTLIRDSYFEDYARDFAEDIGAISSEIGWPGYCIDWERAARELQMDYSCVSFDGVDYWIR